MDKILSPIKERILKYLAISGISRESFYRTTGLSASNFKGAGLKSELGGDKINRILQCFPNLNPEWVLTGRGLMLNDTSPESASYPTAEEQIGLNVSDVTTPQEPLHPDRDPQSGHTQKGSAETAPATPRENPSHGKAENKTAQKNDSTAANSAPLYEFDYRTDLARFFANPPKPAGMLSLPNMPACDGAMYVHNDSMSPLMERGDIFLYKVVKALPDGITRDEIHLLAYASGEAEHLVMGYVRQADDDAYLLVASQNPHLAPKKISIASIRAAARVEVGIRYHAKK